MECEIEPITAALMHVSVQELAGMKTAIDLLRKEHLVQHAENLENLWLKINYSRQSREVEWEPLKAV